MTNELPPSYIPPTEQELERLLQRLPKFSRSRAAESRFFEKLDVFATPRTSWLLWPRVSFAGSFAALVLFVGSLVWAYQPSVTRGHFLYPWKKTAERVELAFARSPLDKIDAHLRFADRRLSEAHIIVARTPSLSFLPVAHAHEEDLHLDSPLAIAFAETLHDMQYEVEQAEVTAEIELETPHETRKALERIETVAEQHVITLTALAAHKDHTISEIARRVAEEEDIRVASVVEAKEIVEQAMTQGHEKVKVHLKKAEKRDEKTRAREEAAEEELRQAQDLFKNLPPEEKDVFSEKMEMAEEALQSGKFGRAEGLSRALKNRIEHTVREKVPGGEKEMDLELPPEKEKESEDKLLPKRSERIKKTLPAVISETEIL